MANQATLPVPGIRLGTTAAGIKKADRDDLVVIEIADGTAVSGVFTQNRFCAAPVQVSREHLQLATPRYLMINTGYANAGTGAKGLEYCRATCDVLANLVGIDAPRVLPFSTGVIGEYFSTDSFEKGLPAALGNLSAEGWERAAGGIMTTDTHPKFASRQVSIQGTTITMTGMAKGCGMIKPNMATMLGFFATDAAIDQTLLDTWLSQLADRSFNRITVDGDTSTNDACMLMATGQAGNSLVKDSESEDAQTLYAALDSLFKELAQALVRDGEGATKFVAIEVEGALSQTGARAVADTIAHSPLVKTALFASDPNWGRILAAIGRAPISHLDVDKVRVWLDDVQIVEAGGLAPGYTEEAGSRVMQQSDITIRVDLGQGHAHETVWTCDFSYDYVKINAEYRT